MGQQGYGRKYFPFFIMKARVLDPKRYWSVMDRSDYDDRVYLDMDGDVGKLSWLGEDLEVLLDSDGGGNVHFRAYVEVSSEDPCEITSAYTNRNSEKTLQRFPTERGGMRRLSVYGTDAVLIFVTPSRDKFDLRFYEPQVHVKDGVFSDPALTGREPLRTFEAISLDELPESLEPEDDDLDLGHYRYLWRVVRKLVERCEERMRKARAIRNAKINEARAVRNKHRRLVSKWGGVGGEVHPVAREVIDDPTHAASVRVALREAEYMPPVTGEPLSPGQSFESGLMNPKVSFWKSIWRRLWPALSSS